MLPECFAYEFKCHRLANYSFKATILQRICYVLRLHFKGSMYLEYCHPILNHDIALMTALIAITGNSINETPYN